MRTGAIVYFFMMSIVANGQKIDWAENYKLSMSDFRSSTTQIGFVNMYGVQTGVMIEFAFAMSNAEFMLTKNWNSKIACTLSQNLASIVAPNDSTAAALVAYAQYDFDLAELCTRKFRKRVFEEKKAFSSTAM